MRRLHRPATDAELWKALRVSVDLLAAAMRLVDPMWSIRYDEPTDTLVVSGPGADLVAMAPGADVLDLLTFCYGAGFGILVATPAHQTPEVAAVLDPLLRGGLQP